MGHTAVIQRSQRTIQKVGALVEHAWRRHLAAAAQRRLSGFLRDLPEAPLAVGFCDSVLAAARIALELAEAFGRDNPVPRFGSASPTAPPSPGRPTSSGPW